MSMTVAALHKRLGALIEAGHGRKPVLVNKASFSHPLEEDGAVMLDIVAIYGPTWIPMADDDGGTKWNKDGTESGKTVVLLSGGDPAGDFAEVPASSTAASGVALPDGGPSQPTDEQLFRAAMDTGLSRFLRHLSEGDMKAVLRSFHSSLLTKLRPSGVPPTHETETKGGA